MYEPQLGGAPLRLKDKVALITGGGGAMGGAQARLFAREGAAVVVSDVDAAGGRAVTEEIVQAGGRSLFAPLDVRDHAQWEACVATAEEELGTLNVLCNNAGANRRVPFDDQTEEMWQEILAVNLTGVFLGTKAAVPAMRRAGGGSIVNIGSLSSVRPGGGSPAYAASKTGLIGLTCTAAKTYAGDGIRCNIVAPGHVDTPFIRANNRTAQTTGPRASRSAVPAGLPAADRARGIPSIPRRSRCIGMPPT